MDTLLQIDEFAKFDDHCGFKRVRQRETLRHLARNNYLIAGAIITGAAVGYQATKKAGEAAAQGGAAEIAELRREYDLTREDLAPFRKLELEAAERSDRFAQRIEQEFTGESQFETSPGYQFRIGEAEKAVGRRASVQGRLNTPSYDLDLARNIGGQAGDEYQRYLSNLFSGAGMAPTQGATAQTVQAGQTASGRIGRAYGDIGESRASQAITQANVISNALDQGSTLYGYRTGGRRG